VQANIEYQYGNWKIMFIFFAASSSRYLRCLLEKLFDLKEWGVRELTRNSWTNLNNKKITLLNNPRNLQRHKKVSPKLISEIALRNRRAPFQVGTCRRTFKIFILHLFSIFSRPSPRTPLRIATTSIEPSQ
jgi:hypothetical protein